MTADPEGRDAQLAAERTDLAWSRSGLSLVACGALIVRGLGGAALPRAHAAIGIVVMTLGALVSFTGAWSARRLRQRHDRSTTTADLAPVSLGVALVGVAAFVVAAWRG